ncbi:MAG: acyl-CoA synthetase (AMP-forming)/AMP-acid ligase [Actinomycetia bacterium]|nr:acyl-CoA synthetase (AMP-forming)/AMP-acid ligase [Actinomycetes bacterium]
MKWPSAINGVVAFGHTSGVSYNLSELFERVADAVPDREAVVTPSRRLRFAELDDRATRAAHVLADLGIAAGDHVGLQLLNGTEYLELMLGAYKLRAVPVNVNYRYVERELAHLYADADIRALVYHQQFAPRIEAVRRDTPTLEHFVVVRDGSDEPPIRGSIAYEAALAKAPATRDFAGRTADDLYIAYTGGTTGLPKGVVWRHEDIFFAAMGAGDPSLSEGPIGDPDEIVERVLPVGARMLIAPPLMHVSAQWGAFSIMYGGGTVVLLSPAAFDAEEVLDLAAQERANAVTLIGDAMARPVLERLRAEPQRWDLSSLFVFATGGTGMATSTRADIAALLPNVILIDGYGSTETGVAGSRARGSDATIEDGARFTVDERTAVLDDDMLPVAPGSGVIGRLARRGHLPLGYYKDAEKTASTIVEANGVRWALAGDMARVETDGTIVLLGRGSVSINTGGEKVYPDEVESVLKDHPDVQDALVVGVPHEHWGEQVVAVVSARPGHQPQLAALQAHCRGSLAGYKVPRALCVVDEVLRGPNGKPDYRWARDRASAVSP